MVSRAVFHGFVGGVTAVVGYAIARLIAPEPSNTAMLIAFLAGYFSALVADVIAP